MKKIYFVKCNSILGNLKILKYHTFSRKHQFFFAICDKYGSNNDTILKDGDF